MTDLNEARLAVAHDLGLETLPGGDGLLDRVLALTSGEGMPVVMEATGVSPEGRISPQDLGLWNDTQAEAFRPLSEGGCPLVGKS